MKLNKGIMLISLITTIVVLLISAASGISLVMYNKDLKQENAQDNKIQKECEHDWVVTSKYDFFRDTYKTISKCSKCGKEVN